VRRLKLDRLLSLQTYPEREAFLAMVVARVLEPRSKLATARELRAATLPSTLGEQLEFSDSDEEPALPGAGLAFAPPSRDRAGLGESIVASIITSGALLSICSCSRTARRSRINWHMQQPGC
jgi:hypothetical protein